MNVTYRLILVDGTETTYNAHVTLDDPGKAYEELHAIFDKHFGEEIEMEHVNVWFDNHYTDMFVDETGVIKKLPINPTATQIYRANVLAHEVNPPDPEELSPIHGDVLLFHQKVWF